MTEPTRPCGTCGMPCTPGEYHPYAACLMFKACHNSETVRTNLEAVRATPPAVAGEPVAWWIPKAEQFCLADKSGDRPFAKAWEPLYTAPQPTQSQAGAVPLTPIRQAALDLYKPPFRHEHGYIRDANNQIVSDDASSVATGLIAARIRGWGRIQYMDKPEMRANALQDEVAEMVAEALNAYWAANGIKGGQHG